MPMVVAWLSAAQINWYFYKVLIKRSWTEGNIKHYERLRVEVERAGERVGS